MPRTSEQLEILRTDRRKLIMDTALELFAERGFSATSISMIAKKAEISKGLVYNYFNSKEDLISAIVNYGIDKIFSGYTNNGILSKDECIFFISESCNIVKTDITFWRLYFMVIIKPETQKLVETMLVEKVFPFIDILTNYYKSQGHKNPLASARLLGAILDGISLNFITDPDNFPLEEVKNILISKFI